MMSTLLPQAAPRATFLPALADAVLCVFKLLRIGPYGHEQRTWQTEICANRASLGTEVPMKAAFAQFDQACSLAQGTTQQQWAVSVIQPALRQVAELFEHMDLITEHPESVRRGLLGCNLLPPQAADRVRRSQADLAAEVAKQLSVLSLQQLRCPVTTEEFTWTGTRHAYGQHLTRIRRGDGNQQVIYPASTKTWDQSIRATRVTLDLPINAYEFDADVHERLWPDHHVKFTGFLLWHNKSRSVDNMLLRSIANNNPEERAIAALAQHLNEHKYTGAAGPVLMIETMAKTGEMNKDELATSVVDFVQSLLRVLEAPSTLGTVVYNTLPAPWIYGPHQTELHPAEWARFSKHHTKVCDVAKRMTTHLRSSFGPDTASVPLIWERRS